MKTRGIIEALLVKREDGMFDICAPHIGSFTASIAVNAVVGGPVPLGEFRIGVRDWTIMLPEGIEGRVHKIVRNAHQDSAEYKQVLLVLQTRVFGSQEEELKDEETLSAGKEFVTPMDGQFYRRPKPEDPPFVEVGDLIQPGDTLGLIEVMKFFYPVTFDGRYPAHILQATIEEMKPVTSGEVLFVLACAKK